MCCTRIHGSSNGNWYLATSRGIKIFNPLTYFYDEIKHDTSTSFSLSSDLVYSVSIDSAGNLWAICTSSSKSILHKIDLKNRTIKYYDRFIDIKKKWSSNTLSEVLTDKTGRVWIIGNLSGLSLYDEQKDNFNDYLHDPFLPNSLLANQNLTIYQDSNGNIWLGTAGYGVSYFNPDRNFFSTIYPVLKAGI
jgi:ligand-binding sensor domain-containing protein